MHAGPQCLQQPGFCSCSPCRALWLVPNPKGLALGLALGASTRERNPTARSRRGCLEQGRNLGYRLSLTQTTSSRDGQRADLSGAARCRQCGTEGRPAAADQPAPLRVLLVYRPGRQPLLLRRRRAGGGARPAHRLAPLPRGSPSNSWNITSGCASTPAVSPPRLDFRGWV